MMFVVGFRLAPFVRCLASKTCMPDWHVQLARFGTVAMYVLWWWLLVDLVCVAVVVVYVIYNLL